MTDETHQGDEEGPRQRTVEIGVALLTLMFGAAILAGSLQVGIGWGVEGPKAGFFPFYISLFIIVSSVVNLVQVAGPLGPGRGLFSSWEQLRRVMSVVVPSVAYVLLVPIIGIYVSSLLLIAIFMTWLGGYGWRMTLPIALGIPVVVYIVFERWFLIALPKGPLEYWLGL